METLGVWTMQTDWQDGADFHLHGSKSLRSYCAFLRLQQRGMETPGDVPVGHLNTTHIICCQCCTAAALPFPDDQAHLPLPVWWLHSYLEPPCYKEPKAIKGVTKSCVSFLGVAKMQMICPLLWTGCHSMPQSVRFCATSLMSWGTWVFTGFTSFLLPSEPPNVLVFSGLFGSITIILSLWWTTILPVRQSKMSHGMVFGLCYNKGQES